MENETIKQCDTCKNFDRYYTRGVKQYNKTKYGHCCKKVESVNIHETCEKYENRGKSKIEKKQVLYCLNRLLADISAIRLIIEEVNNDK